MKKVELLGLSIVAAALIMTTGCSSDDDAPAASGPSAPSDVTAPMDINYTSIKNAMYVATSMANNVLPAAALPTTGGGAESGSQTFDCEVSGSYTETYSYTWDGVENAQHNDGYGLSWSWTETETMTYNNCLDLVSSSTAWPLQLPTNHRLRTGSYSQEWHNAYNVDTNTSTQKNVWNDNYTNAYEDNESDASNTSTYNTTRTRTSEWEGDVSRSNEVAGASYYENEIRNGVEGREDTNTTGSVYYGYKTEKGNYSITNEGVWSETAKYLGNGFTASYDINASGEWELDGSKTFKNFVLSETTDGANESNITVSGTIGNSCLGGSVTFATNPVAQSNEVDYFSDATDPTTNVLPYAGVITVGTATVSFDANDTNHTSAVITGVEADANETVGNWNDLAIQNCVN